MTEDIEQLRRDAERYRWLRSQHWTHDKLVVTRPASLHLGSLTYTMERLDEAIDKAMQSDQPEEKP